MKNQLKYCEIKDLIYFKDQYKENIKTFVTTSDDCLFKNLSIYDFVIKNNLHGKRCMDIGAGTSALGYMLCDRFDEVIIIDMAENNSFYHTKLQHVRDNFFNYETNLSDNSFDLIVESCAITHFEHNSEENIGLKKCAKIISRILKPNSFFLMSSDVISENSIESQGQKEFIKAKEIIDIFETYNLKLISPFDNSSENNDCIIKINYNNNPNFILNYANFVFKKEIL
jgi:2-polyprenyl-3-methyl-5-hydroxy-6-metoxy-1,4-benzoquinol methylase